MNRGAEVQASPRLGGSPHPSAATRSFESLTMPLLDSPITEATALDLPRIFEVWESSVRATHAFLTEADIATLVPLVKEGLAHFTPIHVLREPSGAVYAFLGVADQKVEMLFVHAAHRERGAGRRLLQFAIHALGATQVDVNEQNPQAVGFYEHFGFRTFDRSQLDASGSPFPILHMKLGARASSPSE